MTRTRPTQLTPKPRKSIRERIDEFVGVRGYRRDGNLVGRRRRHFRTTTSSPHERLWIPASMIVRHSNSG